MTAANGRRVTANLVLSIDGRYNGPGGPGDFAAFAPYVGSEVARRQMSRIWPEASTALIGRLNAEGFMAYWPPLAEDDTADPHDRGYATWLVDAEKVVFSRTLAEAPWERTRVVNAPAPEVVADLKAEEGGDILANNSSSIIKPLLEADLVDRLYLLIVPEVAGGGQRLFEDGLPATKWTLVEQEAGDPGVMALVYDRVR
ncbi:dihydrofolate reductase family protein [Nocardiopsis suaedae]|uniref:Dihydrofolate reductase family protein n=1 Tax=Nocardiopsis suaedae TaxID=3018444 RepID=A0ABT4TSB0_9ACTN|nr:dihydrofolate reductase family protein [Nocardiopsis suaedae]MDA2807581.1 dihydrofolate reductase family protein [Nocardiopsis suaedae]